MPCEIGPRGTIGLAVFGQWKFREQAHIDFIREETGRAQGELPGDLFEIPPREV